MAQKSPLARVKAEHGSKAELAQKVLAVLDRPEDEEAESFEQRVKTMSNRKLLRLLAAHELVQTRFGSRENLVGEIVRARFPGGNADYQAKISTFTLPKLVDLGRQHKVLRKAEAPTR